MSGKLIKDNTKNYNISNNTKTIFKKKHWTKLIIITIAYAVFVALLRLP